MEDYVLKMEHISKIYGNGIVANDDIDFNLRKGEVHALVGENGAGKTTLMKILFGMEKPSSGTITLDGKVLDMNSSEDAIANGIGMVHQHFMLVNSFTVAQNIALGIEPKKGLFVDTAKVLSFAKELGEKYHFDIDPNAVVGTLPVGIKQKVEILKALARGAQILILDEPTAVLTPQETDQLFAELEELKRQGHTIIFISHKIREVKAISDRVTVMRNGHSMGVFDTAGVTEAEISSKIVGWEAGAVPDKAGKKPGEVRIRVSDLSYYGGEKVPVLDKVSFAVRSGTILGVAGVQGNGQVELVELMTRARGIESGYIEVNGQDITKMKVRTLRNTGLGYIPEDRLRQGVAKDASISENLVSSAGTTPPVCKKSGFLDRKYIASFADRCIGKYEIKCAGPGAKISMLSGGNMQKVVAARECSGDPKVLIAEQPTRGVDIGAARIIHQSILSLRDEGCAVLLVSADLAEVMELSDALIVMYDGKVVA
ncbi:MAG: ABC transporter ATP-binding protein, partial [Pseudoflavonifractor sp.]